MVKVLIIHQHFKTPQSGGAIRSYYLAKALVDHHINTVVVTCHNEKEYKVENLEGIEVHYLPISYDNRFGFFERSFSFLKFMWASVDKVGELQGITHCYAISVPLTVGIAAMRIKAKFRIPFIFEVGDLWPDAPIQLGFVRNYFLKVILYQLEKSIYQAADSLVALSPAIKTAIEKKVPGKQVRMVPNMADCDFYTPASKDTHLEQKFGARGKFVVSYIGAVGVANGLDYFLECANASRKNELPILFLLCGDGALLDRLKRNAAHLNLQNLSFLSFTNREGVREILDVTDAVFVCYKKNIPVLETGSPNKYFDGLAAGKLIVLNFGGWVRKEIEETRCGIYCDPNNPVDFVNRISPFISDQKLLQSYQLSARELGEKKYSRKRLAEEFRKLFTAPV